MIRRLLIALSVAALALVAFVTPPKQRAIAAQSVLCAPDGYNTAAGARTIGGTLSQVPSGTVYSLNSNGCTIVAQADIGYFLSQGFAPGPPFGPNILFTTGTWTGTTSFQVGNLPVGTYIQHIIFSNSTANAVTGGIAVGTTSGGADVVAAQACGANCLVFVADSALLKRVFSTTAQQAIFITPVTAGNNANVTATVVFGYF